MKLSGKTILITGATGGIGSAVALELASRDASLIIVGRNAKRLDALFARLRALGTEVLPIAADIADVEQRTRLVEKILERGATLDILINCAGVQNFGFFQNETGAEISTLFDVNTVAPIALINAFLPHMLHRRSGSIVNVGSIFGSIGFPCFATYSASKFALRGFSEALRRELSDTGVNVTYVAPRFTKTPFNRSEVVRMADELKMRQDEPQVVAASVVAAIESQRGSRYIGWPERLFVRINSIMPRLVDIPLMKQVHRMRPFATASTADSLES